MTDGCVSPFPRELLMSLYGGTVNYRYRGVPCWKDPIDLAILARLLWDVKPRTIIEVGSNAGGSALWFGDQLRAYGIDGVVHSVDVRRPDDLRVVLQDNVKFYSGDGRDLGETFSERWLADQPRPIMVSEDADHSATTTLVVLRWFDSFAQPGEYAVVEDGNTNEIIPGGHQCGGPLAGIKMFLDERGGDYEVDRKYCDMFGVGVTFFPDGYIRRK